MRTLISHVLHQRLVVLVVSLILLVFGLNAAKHLSVDAFPDVTNVQVQIATEAPGKSPEEVERFITIPIEIGMTGLPGLTDMRSLNKPGLSLITLVFEDGRGVYFERQLVSERLSELRDRMPQGVTPVLGPVSNALGEVYQYTLETGEDGKRALTREELIDRRTVQDWVVRPLLRSIPGVAEINSTGGYVKEYQALVDPQKLRYYGLSINDVYEALRNNNENAGGGILPQHDEQYLIRSTGLIRNIDDIRKIVLRESAGTPVYIRDVAEVRIGEEVRYGAMVKGGYTEAVGGVVMMTAGGNAKEIVTRIKERVAEINGKNMIPGRLKIVPYYDRSRLVDAAIHTVTEVLAEGIVLVVVVLYLYHGSAESRLHLVRDAVVEVATPVIFGVLIIVLVFLPLMTLEGTEGKMFSPLAYTIAIALLLSLVLSLTLSPALSMFWLKGGTEKDTRLVHWLRAPYERVLTWAMQNKVKSILAVVLLFVVSLCLFPFLGTAFIPEMQEGTIGPNADRVPNISLDESIKMELEMQRLMRAIPGVENVVSRLGRGESPADPAGPNEADVMANLAPVDKRPRDLTQERIADQVRDALAALPGINLVMSQPISDRVDEMVTGVRADVAVKVFGDDLDTLIAKAQEIARVATSIPGTQDTRVDRVGGQQYLVIDIDRSAIARYGLNAADVNDTIEMAIAGKSATEIYEGERRFQAVVRLPASYRSKIDDIRQIMVSSPSGPRVPLEDLAMIRVLEGPAQINRDMAKRRIVVGINVQGRDLGGYVADLQRAVNQEVQLPSGYFIQWGGQFQNMQRAMRHLMIIVPVTIGAIFFLLFLLFHSVRFAALIITVLPLASIGGIFGLFISREYLSVPASVGFIALWGIAVLNGVVLVSYIRKLRSEGASQVEAIMRGTYLRFRPVMMTATVAALGLVPFLFAGGPGSEIQRPLAIVVIGGLLTSTMLTLIVVPCLYALFEGKPQDIADTEMEHHLLS